MPFIAGMGPRARRRAAWLATVGLVVIGVVAYHVATSSGHPPVKQKGENPNMDLGISYGWSTKQVADHLGQPTRKQAACWIYNAPAGKVTGIDAGPLTTAVKFCFTGGIVSNIWDHEAASTYRGVNHPAAWIHPLYFSPSYEHPVAPQF